MSDTQGQRAVWRSRPRGPDDLVAALPGVHPALIQILYNRGLCTPAMCSDFLDGVCRDPDDPALLADLPLAVGRLLLARERGEPIAIYTDYDADGINAAAALTT